MAVCILTKQLSVAVLHWLNLLECLDCRCYTGTTCHHVHMHDAFTDEMVC